MSILVPTPLKFKSKKPKCFDLAQPDYTGTPDAPDILPLPADLAEHVNDQIGYAQYQNECADAARFFARFIDPFAWCLDTPAARPTDIEVANAKQNKGNDGYTLHTRTKEDGTTYTFKTPPFCAYQYERNISRKIYCKADPNKSQAIWMIDVDDHDNDGRLEERKAKVEKYFNISNLPSSRGHHYWLIGPNDPELSLLLQQTLGIEVKGLNTLGRLPNAHDGFCADWLKAFARQRHYTRADILSIIQQVQQDDGYKKQQYWREKKERQQQVRIISVDPTKPSRHVETTIDNAFIRQQHGVSRYYQVHGGTPNVQDADKVINWLITNGFVRSFDGRTKSRAKAILRYFAKHWKVSTRFGMETCLNKGKRAATALKEAELLPDTLRTGAANGVVVKPEYWPAFFAVLFSIKTPHKPSHWIEERWNRLYEAGKVSVRFHGSRWAAMRNYLQDVGLLEFVSERYAYRIGQHVGKAMIWDCPLVRADRILITKEKHIYWYLLDREYKRTLQPQKIRPIADFRLLEQLSQPPPLDTDEKRRVFEAVTGWNLAA